MVRCALACIHVCARDRCVASLPCHELHWRFIAMRMHVMSPPACARRRAIVRACYLAAGTAAALMPTASNITRASFDESSTWHEHLLRPTYCIRRRKRLNYMQAVRSSSQRIRQNQARFDESSHIFQQSIKNLAEDVRLPQPAPRDAMLTRMCRQLARHRDSVEYVCRRLKRGKCRVQWRSHGRLPEQ